MYVRNISGAFKETIVQGTCRKISANSLPSRVLTTLSSWSNRKTSTWPRWALNLSPRYNYVILVSKHLDFTSVNYNHNMDIQYQRYTYGNGATLLFFKVWGLVYGRKDVLTDGRTDGRIYIRTYRRIVAWQPNCFRSKVYQIWVWGSALYPSARLSSAGIYL